MSRKPFCVLVLHHMINRFNNHRFVIIKINKTHEMATISSFTLILSKSLKTFLDDSVDSVSFVDFVKIVEDLLAVDLVDSVDSVSFVDYVKIVKTLFPSILSLPSIFAKFIDVIRF